MWSWFVSIVQAYWAWATSWMKIVQESTSLSAVLAAHPLAFPLVPVFCGVAGAIALYRVLTKDEQTPWSRIKSGCLGLFMGFALGLLVGTVIFILAPFMIAIGVLTLIALSASASVLYCSQAIGVAKSLVSRIRPTVGRLYRVFRQKLALRRKPTDYLAELDASALETERRLKDLLVQQESLQSYAEKCGARIRKTDEVWRSVPLRSVAAQIADELRTKFESELRSAEAARAALTPLIEQIRQGQTEMSHLVTLARLCHESREVAPERASALEAARKAYAALQKAFERADAVLSAAVVEADLSLELAFQQSDEAYQRSVQLNDAVESVGTPATARIRA